MTQVANWPRRVSVANTLNRSTIPCVPPALGDETDHAAEHDRENQDRRVARIHDLTDDEAVDRARKGGHRIPFEEDHRAAKNPKKERDDHVAHQERQTDREQRRQERHPTGNDPELDFLRAGGAADLEGMTTARQLDVVKMDLVFVRLELQTLDGLAVDQDLDR